MAPPQAALKRQKSKVSDQSSNEKLGKLSASKPKNVKARPILTLSDDKSDISKGKSGEVKAKPVVKKKNAMAMF